VTAVMRRNLRCLREMAMPCLPVREKHNRSMAVGRSRGGGDVKYSRFLAVVIAGRIFHVTLLEKCYSNYNNSCVVSQRKFVYSLYVTYDLSGLASLVLHKENIVHEFVIIPIFRTCSCVPIIWLRLPTVCPIL
jgi:hypothetical protein